MAANTDLLKKLSRRWVGQIGSGGVADASVTTIPLASTTNLPTGTAVVITIDRVDSSGTATSNLEETIIGVVSGSNLVTCTRGVEGTAQSHAAGAVAEVLVTAKGWNDIVDHLLVEHNQDGTHAAIILKTTATQVVTNKDLTSGTNTFPTSLVTLTGTQTQTNKRITKRTGTVASSATPTINTDNVDVFTITALALAITSMTTNLSGTPTEGQGLIIRILDDGTARAISWGASFASRGATLPTTTVLSKYLYVGLIWNSVASKWDCIATAQES